MKLGVPKFDARFGSNRAFGDLGWIGLILIGVTSMLLTGALRPLDDLLAATRFQAAPREASQNLTIVEIDSRSLRSAGAWPWDRARYATALDNLASAGATVVALDVDFSARSNGSGDQALAEAISRRPGQVVLASFRQADTYGSPASGLVHNVPLPEFAREALLGAVNVPVDSDGEVRAYDGSSNAPGQTSIAMVLAGTSSVGDFEIDYGIDHRTIPHLSFDDVLANRFDPALVSGKVVLIGATALELGDEFATPAGLIPGVYIHGLAYESLVQGRTLRSLNPAVLILLSALVALLLRPRPREGAAPHGLVTRHLATGGALLIVPVIVQAASPVSLHVAPLLCVQAVMVVWAIRVELERRARAIIAEREAGLVHLALHQPDTGLPNRRALLQHIETFWRQAPDSPVAVVALRVARHAEMRGVVGYGVADALLVELADRAHRLTGGSVTQISSAVLALVHTGLGASELPALLERLDELETSFEVEGVSIDIFTRRGAASGYSASISPELLVERATLALNRADAGDEHTVIYDPATFGSPANNLALMSEMHRAVASGDIALHYQPKMSLAQGEVASVEALCRWRHPVRGFIGPDVFIPVAEETGQIRVLTEWSLEQAIRDQRRLREWGHEVTIALNVSGRLLTDEAFRERALKLVAGTQADLCFEITETAVIQQPALAREAIAAYRAAGIKISIDDYGSGLSSLSYLKMLHADELKIDRSLVVDILSSQRDRLILKSTVDLAHGLGMSVVAEGVETEAVAACLRLLGCDVIQGYWIARPIPILQLAEFLDGGATKGEHAADDLTVAASQRANLRVRPA